MLPDSVIESLLASFSPKSTPQRSAAPSTDGRGSTAFTAFLQRARTRLATGADQPTTLSSATSSLKTSTSNTPNVLPAATATSTADDLSTQTLTPTDSAAVNRKNAVQVPTGTRASGAGALSAARQTQELATEDSAINKNPLNAERAEQAAQGITPPTTNTPNQSAKAKEREQVQAPKSSPQSSSAPASDTKTRYESLSETQNAKMQEVLPRVMLELFGVSSAHEQAVILQSLQNGTPDLATLESISRELQNASTSNQAGSIKSAVDLETTMTNQLGQNGSASKHSAISHNDSEPPTLNSAKHPKAVEPATAAVVNQPKHQAEHQSIGPDTLPARSAAPQVSAEQIHEADNHKLSAAQAKIQQSQNSAERQPAREILQPLTAAKLPDVNTSPTADNVNSTAEHKLDATTAAQKRTANVAVNLAGETSKAGPQQTGGPSAAPSNSGQGTAPDSAQKSAETQGRAAQTANPQHSSSNSAGTIPATDPAPTASVVPASVPARAQNAEVTLLQLDFAGGQIRMAGSASDTTSELQSSAAQKAGGAPQIELPATAQVRPQSVATAGASNHSAANVTTLVPRSAELVLDAPIREQGQTILPQILRIGLDEAAAETTNASAAKPTSHQTALGAMTRLNTLMQALGALGGTVSSLRIIGEVGAQLGAKAGIDVKGGSQNLQTGDMQPPANWGLSAETLKQLRALSSGPAANVKAAGPNSGTLLADQTIAASGAAAVQHAEAGGALKSVPADKTVKIPTAQLAQQSVQDVAAPKSSGQLFIDNANVSRKDATQSILFGTDSQAGRATAKPENSSSSGSRPALNISDGQTSVTVNAGQPTAVKADQATTQSAAGSAVGKAGVNFGSVPRTENGSTPTQQQVAFSSAAERSQPQSATATSSETDVKQSVSQQNVKSAVAPSEMSSQIKQAAKAAPAELHKQESQPSSAAVSEKHATSKAGHTADTAAQHSARGSADAGLPKVGNALKPDNINVAAAKTQPQTAKNDLTQKQESVAGAGTPHRSVAAGESANVKQTTQAAKAAATVRTEQQTPTASVRNAPRQTQPAASTASSGSAASSTAKPTSAQIDGVLNAAKTAQQVKPANAVANPTESMPVNGPVVRSHGVTDSEKPAPHSVPKSSQTRHAQSADVDSAVARNMSRSASQTATQNVSPTASQSPALSAAPAKNSGLTMDGGSANNSAMSATELNLSRKDGRKVADKVAHKPAANLGAAAQQSLKSEAPSVQQLNRASGQNSASRVEVTRQTPNSGASQSAGPIAVSENSVAGGRATLAPSGSNGQIESSAAKTFIENSGQPLNNTTGTRKAVLANADGKGTDSAAPKAPKSDQALAASTRNSSGTEHAGNRLNAASQKAAGSAAQSPNSQSGHVNSFADKRPAAPLKSQPLPAAPGQADKLTGSQAPSPAQSSAQLSAKSSTQSLAESQAQGRRREVLQPLSSRGAQVRAETPDDVVASKPKNGAGSPIAKGQSPAQQVAGPSAERSQAAQNGKPAQPSAVSAGTLDKGLVASGGALKSVGSAAADSGAAGRLQADGPGTSQAMNAQVAVKSRQDAQAAEQNLVRNVSRNIRPSAAQPPAQKIPTSDTSPQRVVSVKQHVQPDASARHGQKLASADLQGGPTSDKNSAESTIAASKDVKTLEAAAGNVNNNGKGNSDRLGSQNRSQNAGRNIGQGVGRGEAQNVGQNVGQNVDKKFDKNAGQNVNRSDSTSTNSVVAAKPVAAERSVKQETAEAATRVSPKTQQSNAQTASLKQSVLHQASPNHENVVSGKSAATSPVSGADKSVQQSASVNETHGSLTTKDAQPKAADFSQPVADKLHGKAIDSGSLKAGQTEAGRGAELKTRGPEAAPQATAPSAAATSLAKDSGTTQPAAAPMLKNAAPADKPQTETPSADKQIDKPGKQNARAEGIKSVQVEVPKDAPLAGRRSAAMNIASASFEHAPKTMLDPLRTAEVLRRAAAQLRRPTQVAGPAAPNASEVRAASEVRRPDVALQSSTPRNTMQSAASVANGAIAQSESGVNHSPANMGNMSNPFGAEVLSIFARSAAEELRPARDVRPEPQAENRPAQQQNVAPRAAEEAAARELRPRLALHERTAAESSVPRTSEQSALGGEGGQERHSGRQGDKDSSRQHSGDQSAKQELQSSAKLEQEKVLQAGNNTAAAQRFDEVLRDQGRAPRSVAAPEAQTAQLAAEAGRRTDVRAERATTGRERVIKTLRRVAVHRWADTTFGALRTLPAGRGAAIAMTLNPESLGSVMVELTVNKGVAQIKIQTERVETRRILEQHAIVLKDKLVQSGVTVDSIDITVRDSELREDSRGETAADKRQSEREQQNERQEFIDSFRYLRKDLELEAAGTAAEAPAASQPETAAVAAGSDGFERYA